jgi:hypothetical protein
MDPEDVVAESLSALERGTVLCVPGFGNRALTSLTRLVPHEVTRRVAGVLMQQVKGRRPHERPIGSPPRRG